MSGVHATIAAMLAAFAIPALPKVKEEKFANHMDSLVTRFKNADPNSVRTLTKEQFTILMEIRSYSKQALTPLQRLENSLHPVVVFVIMPIFAFINAGVTLSDDFLLQLISPVSLGIMSGLLLGKIIGVVGTTQLVMKIAGIGLPKGMTNLHLLGAGFLAAIGFTMSLFISGLAFKQEYLSDQAKIGILTASLLASIVGYFIIKNASSSKP